MGKSGIVCVLMAVTLVGCTGGGSESPVPPLTLIPPPTVTFAGSCSENGDLANWLEYSTFYVGEFVKLVTETAARSRAEMYDSVVLMDRMRADFSGVAAPDCAQTAHDMIVSSMTRAVDGFQAVINQDADNLGSTVAEVLGQLDRVIAMQNELMARLEIQLQSP